MKTVNIITLVNETIVRIEAKSIEGSINPEIIEIETASGRRFRMYQRPRLLRAGVYRIH